MRILVDLMYTYIHFHCSTNNSKLVFTTQIQHRGAKWLTGVRVAGELCVKFRCVGPVMFIERM